MRCKCNFNEEEINELCLVQTTVQWRNLSYYSDVLYVEINAGLWVHVDADQPVPVATRIRPYTPPNAGKLPWRPCTLHNGTSQVTLGSIVWCLENCLSVKNSHILYAKRSPFIHRRTLRNRILKSLSTNTKLRM